jgi:hypothetical protein
MILKILCLKTGLGFWKMPGSKATFIINFYFDIPAAFVLLMRRIGF